MARRYGDEDCDRSVIDALRRLGHDVFTVQEAGQANQGTPVAAILAFATSAARAVLTFNRRDFINLHHRQPKHSGIIVCTREPDASALAARIHRAIEADDALEGRLVRITRPQNTLAETPGPWMTRSPSRRRVCTTLPHLGRSRKIALVKQNFLGIGLEIAYHRQEPTPLAARPEPVRTLSPRSR